MSEPFYYEPITSDILCTHRRTTDNPTYYYHRHNTYEIYLFLQGNIHFYQNHHCYELSAGDLVLLSPFHMHRVVSEENTIYERITINISSAMLKNLSTETTDLASCFLKDEEEICKPVSLPDEQLASFISYSNKLSEALSSDSYGADIRTRIYISQILLLINECQKNLSPAPNIMPQLVQNIMLYIQEHLEDEITLADLSSKFYVSKTQISRSFKRHTGLTLRTYILDQRIQKTKQLLKRGYTISEACFSSGFSDYSNFMRSFKKMTGLTPGQFIKTSL